MLTVEQWDKLHEILDKITAEDLTEVSYRGTGIFSFDAKTNDYTSEIVAIKHCLLRRLGHEYNIALTAMLTNNYDAYSYDEIILNFEFSLK